MRTSLSEIESIENWLTGRGDQGDRLLTEAKIQLDTDLRANARWQETTYRVVRQYGREKLKEEISKVDHRLFTSSRYRSFQARILSIFKK
ncbi:MAG: hypothetical protein AAGA66_04495 [Bacteroidota bacterium]